jgi:uncharacterized protein (TIGR02118 family)
MIKLTFALTRLPGLSRDDFQDYWVNRHAPLVASVREALHIRRYVQVHSCPDEASEALRASRGAPPAYDGVAELWYDNLEAIAAAVRTEAGAKASRLLLEDERKFIDLSRSPLWWGREHSIF